MAMIFLLHGTDLFLLNPAPLDSVLYSMLQVKRFRCLAILPDLCCVSSGAQTDTPALPRRVSDTRISIITRGQGKAFHTALGREYDFTWFHMISPTVTGNHDFYWFLVSTKPEFQLPPNQSREYFHASIQPRGRTIWNWEVHDGLTHKETACCWLDWGCSHILAGTNAYAPNTQVTWSPCKLPTYE